MPVKWVISNWTDYCHDISAARKTKFSKHIAFFLLLDTFGFVTKEQNSELEIQVEGIGWFQTNNYFKVEKNIRRDAGLRQIASEDNASIIKPRDHYIL